MACFVMENAAVMRACDAMTVAQVASAISGYSAHCATASTPVVSRTTEGAVGSA